MAGSWGSESDDLGISSDGSEHEEETRQPRPGAGEGAADVPGPAAASSDELGGAREGEEVELKEYARSLGVDLDKAEEADLRWVVKEAFAAPLPVSWTEHLDEEGRVYFFNQITQESSWLHPMDSVFKEVIELVKAHRGPAKPKGKADAATSSASSAAVKHEVVQAHLEKAHSEALGNIEAWSGPYSSDAGQYYYNAQHDVSSWENPIDDWQKQLALRQRILHRCLLEDDPLPESKAAGAELGRQTSSDGGAAESSDASAAPPSLAGLGDPLLELPRLPLSLTMPSIAAGEGAPKSPSSTRSFATARSGRSARSARSPTPTRALNSAASAAAATRGLSSPKSSHTGKPKTLTATPKVASTAPTASVDPPRRKGSGDGEELEFTFGSTQNLQLPRFGAVNAPAGASAGDGK